MQPAEKTHHARRLQIENWTGGRPAGSSRMGGYNKHDVQRLAGSLHLCTGAPDLLLLQPPATAHAIILQHVQGTARS